MVWAGHWSRSEAERTIESAARIGYDIVEIPFMDAEDFDVAYTRELLKTNKIAGAISLVFARRRRFERRCGESAPRRRVPEESS